MADPKPPELPALRIPIGLLEQSARLLRDLSADRREAVILWAGVPGSHTVTVSRIVVPQYTSTLVRFEVPLEERRKLAERLGEHGEIVLAQLHTHPGAAFHSAADDRLALPRHTGAISIVVPCFAEDWRGNLGETSVNIHRGGGVWSELSDSEIQALFEVIR